MMMREKFHTQPYMLRASQLVHWGWPASSDPRPLSRLRIASVTSVTVPVRSHPTLRQLLGDPTDIPLLPTDGQTTHSAGQWLTI